MALNDPASARMATGGDMSQRDEGGRFAPSGKTLARRHGALIGAAIDARGDKHRGLIYSLHPPSPDRTRPESFHPQPQPRPGLH